MDSQPSPLEAIDVGNIDDQYRYHPQPRAGKAGRRREKPKETKQPIGRALVRLIRQCLPWYWNALDAVEDPREDPLYSMGQVLNLGVLMFACRLSSLRMLDRVTEDAVFRDNWCVFSRAATDTLVCSRQMTNVLAVIDRGPIAALRPRAIKQLLRAKRLPGAFLAGHMMVVSDGTGIFSSHEPHCPQCLTQKHQNGSMTYLHNMLEAKVVTREGLALSVMSVPVLNPEDGKYDKQDCESKAFKRLLPQLKQEFPREPIVHLLDGLFCNGPTFAAIDQLKQKFIVCFQRGSISTLYDEALELRKLSPLNRIRKTLRRDGCEVAQDYTWVNEMEYQEQTLNFVMCEETVNELTTTFAYLTNLPVNRDTVMEVAQGGRMRWTIENQGFNTQKTGYDMEHFCDCNNLETMMALYLLLQIAHMLMQLLANSNLIQDVSNHTFLAALLLEALRNLPLTEEIFAPDMPASQIRFTKAPP